MDWLKDRCFGKSTVCSSPSILCFRVGHRSGWILRMSYDRDSACRSGSRMSIPRFHMWLVAKLNSFWVPLAVVVVVVVLVVCCLLFVVASCDRFQSLFYKPFGPAAIRPRSTCGEPTKMPHWSKSQCRRTMDFSSTHAESKCFKSRVLLWCLRIWLLLSKFPLITSKPSSIQWKLYLAEGHSVVGER